MTLTPEAIHRAATELAARRTHARAGSRLPEADRPLDLDDAWAIQCAVRGLTGQAIGGWKASLPSPGKLVAASINAVDIGRTPHMTAPAISRAANAAQLNIEPEIAYVLATDLPPREAAYTEAEIDAAVGSVHAAIEICNSRYTDATGLPFVEMMADGQVNAGLWLGPEIAGPEAGHFDLRWQAGEQDAVHLAARHPDGHPRAPFHWLANFLRERGIGLFAGQVVTTGSYAGLLSAPIGQPLIFDYAGLASFSVQFD